MRAALLALRFFEEWWIRKHGLLAPGILLSITFRFQPEFHPCWKNASANSQQRPSPRWENIVQMKNGAGCTISEGFFFFQQLIFGVLFSAKKSDINGKDFSFLFIDLAAMPVRGCTKNNTLYPLLSTVAVL